VDIAYNSETAVKKRLVNYDMTKFMMSSSFFLQFIFVTQELAVIKLEIWNDRNWWQIDSRVCCDSFIYFDFHSNICITIRSFVI